MNPYYRFEDIPYVWYELSWPVELDAEQVAVCLKSLSGSNFSTGLRLVMQATSEGIKHYLVVPEELDPAISRFMHTFLPEVELVEAEPALMTSSVAMRLRMTTKNRILNVEQPEILSYGILSTLQDLEEGERVTVMWMLGHTLAPVAIPREAVQFETNTQLGRLAESFIRSPKRLDGFAHISMQEKHAVHTWAAVCIIGAQAPSTGRGYQLLGHLMGAMRSAQAPGVRIKFRPTLPACLDERYQPVFWTIRVNARELTGLLGWPYGDQPMPGIVRNTSRHLEVPTNLPLSDRAIAQSNVAGSGQYLTLSPQDGLMHTHVLGPTGVGKSTLLLNLILQDVTAGRGAIVIDPKGDLVTDVLQRIPTYRSDDVVLLDPSDDTMPVGLNPLAGRNRPAALIADDILSIFKGLYGSYFGPRTQDVMHAGLLTLCSVPGMSLCALPVLYTNPTFRARLVSKLNDPLGLGSFWSWYDGISESERITVLAPVMNKLRAFLLRPAMRRVIGQSQPKFALSDAMSSNKIVLVNLAKGTLGKDTSQLFGALVIAQVWQAIQARVTVPMEYRQPMFVYVDEVQDYLRLPTDIGDVLAQSRGYGVGMVLAHQHLGQLPKELKAGILSNARSRICFQLSHEDAVVMSKDSKLLTPQDFEGLSRYNVYARLVARGEVQPWASGKTWAPREPANDVAAIRKLSRERYGVDATEVEAAIARQIGGDLVAGKRSAIGRRQKIEVAS